VERGRGRALRQVAGGRRGPDGGCRRGQCVKRPRQVLSMLNVE
jgi:hypothetical protein